jgi:hypothetical protein
MFIARKLLWVDCTAAAIAGVAVLALSGGLSRLHVLPLELLLFIGADNLLYGSYSFTLASGAERSMCLIKVLACANAAWSVVCVGLAATIWGQASLWGIAHLVGEAMFVGGLAAMEWSQRYLLATIPRAQMAGAVTS